MENMNNNIKTPVLSTKGDKEENLFTAHNFDYFKKSIEWNLKDNFFSNNPNKEYREWMLERDYRYFTKKLDMFRESVDEEYPNYWDFDFIQNYLTKIFRTLYNNKTIISVFETNEIKERFFNCMKKYFFWNFWPMNVELVEKYPKKIKSLLTKEEEESLLRSIQD